MLTTFHNMTNCGRYRLSLMILFYSIINCTLSLLFDYCNNAKFDKHFSWAWNTFENILHNTKEGTKFLIRTCSETLFARFFLLFPFPSLFLAVAWDTGNTEIAFPVEQSRVGIGTVSLGSGAVKVCHWGDHRLNQFCKIKAAFTLMHFMH